MSIGIIIAVIAFIFFISRSVENQNRQERKRREQRRARSVPTGGQTADDQSAGERQPDVQPGPVLKPAAKDASGESDIMKRYRKAVDQSSRTAGGSPLVSGQVITSLEPAVRHNRPEWMNNRHAARQAFIFSECIGKPRAVEPHPYFNRNRK
ncbi:hypothetical protein [Sporolactobacillus pectinivorans]|uniref:hypothetical protein n=1 Tax=Sporolactobacillus pectinivorans TaxID=1591408 RepID=UPI000C256F35|nr:hypothetical protein [Sporolactobacillus pectinivorans]